MKYVFSIRESENRTFFNQMKNEYEYALFVLAVMEKILVSPNEHKKPDCAYVLLDENVFHHRIFIVSKAKIVSFVFDFNLTPSESEIPSISFGDFVLSTEIISCAKMIIYQLMRTERDWIHEEDNDLREEYNPNALDISHKLIKKIIYSEPSYIRYEYDTEHAKGSKHPLHHLDINFSEDGSYKIGVESRAHSTDINFFMDLLNTETDCSMIQK